jgi:hypothetical protein
MATTPIYEFACQLAPFAPPPPEMVTLFGALGGNQAETNRFLGVFAQTVSPADFFSPESMGRIWVVGRAEGFHRIASLAGRRPASGRVRRSPQ